MRIVLAIKKERCDAKVKTLPPDANDFARMIERYNREMQQYVAINPRPEPAPPDGSPGEQAVFAEAPPPLPISRRRKIGRKVRFFLLQKQPQNRRRHRPLPTRTQPRIYI